MASKAPSLSLELHQEVLARICALCGKTEGEHARIGDWCPRIGETSGPIFSDLFKFRPRESEDWKPGDTYTVLKRDSLVIVGIVNSIGCSGMLIGLEIITHSDGALMSFSASGRMPEEVVRLVPE